MKRYNPSELEAKWQAIWSDQKTYQATDFGDDKIYTAEMFPYPSGSGLHVGHVRNFTIVDVLARFYRQLGHNVLRPIGWDTFGLPAENYAIKTGISPQTATKQNIDYFRHQFKRIGMAVDWSREINSSHPEYYRWTQWIFARLFEKGLAYQKESDQWWCPIDKTVLANEQVENGKCWRCGSEVEKKKMKQWFFKITAYADELLDSLDDLDWPAKIKTMQRNWIGRSVGAEIDFAVLSLNDSAADSQGSNLGLAASSAPLAAAGESLLAISSPEKPLQAAKAESFSFPDGPSAASATGIESFSFSNDLSTPESQSQPAAVFGDPQPNEIEKRAIMAIIRNPKTGQVLTLNWGKRHANFGGRIFIGGTMEGDEDPLTAARREIAEETGYVNLKHIKSADRWIENHFYSNTKNQAVKARFLPMLFELEDDKQAKTNLDSGEVGKFSIQWVDEANLAGTIDDPAHYYGYELLTKPGAVVDKSFSLPNNLSTPLKITVFTTRPDTIFGATFMVLAPEHPLVVKITTLEQKQAVNNYVKATQAKTDIERQENKHKTGVFTGSYAINPATNQPIPIWIADYVLADYGEGAIMAVPAHDERDYQFAKKYDLPIVDVIKAPNDDEEIYTGEGVLVNSETVNWRDLAEAKAQAESDLERGLVREFGESQPGEVDVYGTVILGYNPKTNKYLGIRTEKALIPVWLPGGSINQGETFADCARRELKEETGYEAKELVQLGPPIVSHYFNSIKKSHRRSFAPHYIAIIEEEPGATARESHEADFSNQWFDYKELKKAIALGGNNTEHWIFILENAKRFVDNGLKLPDDLQTSFNGLASSEAREKIVNWLAGKAAAREKVNYKMRDWLISRQRYWGAPIPIAYDKHGQPHLIPDDQLPVLLPEIDDYQPDNSGRSALAKAKDWLKVTIDGQEMTRETDTMDGYACSSWYLLRYCDPRNRDQAWDSAKINYWNPVDFYVGGDHATAHLLYVRFWTKFFADEGLINFREPVKKLLYNGYVNAPDGKKMSKSRGNVIDPLDIIDNGYGADTLRVYEMFMGPYEQDVAWDVSSVGGVYRFLNRVWNLAQDFIENPKDQTDQTLLRAQHKTIKKVTEDLHRAGFNTAIAALMEYLNVLTKQPAKVSRQNLETLLKLLAPFAPHLSSELFDQLGNKQLIDFAGWPDWDEKLTIDDEITIGVQINGKLRDEITIARQADEASVRAATLELDKIKSHLAGRQPQKVIYVPGRIVNLIV